MSKPLLDICPSRLPRHAVRRVNRKGGAAVELAVCLPLIVFLFLSSMDTANTVYLKQAATSAAYETARVATSTGGTQDMALTRANEIFASREIEGATVDISPALDAETPRGTTITVNVTVPSDANSLGVGSLFRGREVNASVVMVRL